MRFSTLIILIVEVLYFDNTNIPRAYIEYKPLHLWLRALVCGCGCFVVFLVIYWILETLWLTHVYSNSLHACIYASLHVHICMRYLLVMFGSLLVNLGEFRGKILAWHLYAFTSTPRAHRFSRIYYKYVLYKSTWCTLIERSVIETIHMCYFILFCCYLAYFVKYFDC